MIDKKETKIQCRLTLIGKKLIESDECRRIQLLRDNYLIKIATIPDEWLILYQDPKDKRYWELRFEYAEMQGGGPPTLICISEEEARSKYKI